MPQKIPVSIRPKVPWLDVDQVADLVKKAYRVEITYISRITKTVFGGVPKEWLSALKADPNLIVREERVPVKAIGSPSLGNSPQYPPTTAARKIGIDYSWRLGYTGRGIKVAVLDSGIRKTHEVFGGRVIYENYFIGKDAFDHFGHGTSTASCIAGYVPEKEFIAPAYEASILNIKVLGDDGTGTVESVVKGIDCAIEQGAWVINCSFGMPDDGDPNNPIRVACREAIKRNIWVYAAAGNRGPAPKTIEIPAVEKYVVAIGCVGWDDIISDHSSRGPTLEGLIKPDGACYGIDILCAWKGSDTAYKPFSLTSFSTPIVSGCAAILRQIAPRMTVETMFAFLPYIARKPPVAPKPAGEKDNWYGWGIPDARAMVERIVPPPILIPYRIYPLIAPFCVLATLMMTWTTLMRLIVPLFKGLR